MFFSAPVFAHERKIIHGDVDTEFSLYYKDLPEEINFITSEEHVISGVGVIPKHSEVTIEIVTAQRERRWHKSGFILGKLKSYQWEDADAPINLSDKDIYIVMRKHERVDGLGATLFATEYILWQGVALFAPGVDIAYYFTKGAILREKSPNWFKAGVHNAYDNSLCWLWLKGKPITLYPDDEIAAKRITPKKAEKIQHNAEKWSAKQEVRFNKKIDKKDRKYAKRQHKNEKKMYRCNVVEQAIQHELAEDI